MKINKLLPENIQTERRDNDKNYRVALLFTTPGGPA